MPNFTPKLNLIKPLGSENFSVAHANGNADKLDNAFIQTDERLNSSVSEIYNVVHGYGAKGDGITDDTASIQAAIDAASVSGGTVFIPKGTFIITDTLVIKSNVSILGLGKCSVIKSNFDAFKYALQSNSQLTRTLISNIAIESDAGSLSGGIKVESAQRGNTIKDVWFLYVSNPIYMGDQVYAIYDISNVYAVFFSSITDNALLDQAIGIYIKGNTVMLNSVEIVGNFGYGLYYDTAMLGRASGINISGSAGYAMKRGIYIKDSQQLSFDTAWIEQIDTAGVSTFLNESIKLQNCDVISFNNMQISNGSVFVDNSKMDWKNSKFYTADTGIRTINGSNITTDKDSFGTANFQGDINYQNGIIDVENSNDSSVNILNNPLILNGVVEPVTALNANSTITSDTSLFYSGDKSMRVTCSADFAGSRIDMRNVVKNGMRYTLICRVKKVSNVNYLAITGLSGTSTVNNYPNVAQNSSKGNDWHFITYTFTATDSSNCFARIYCSRDNSSSNAVFNVDSVFLYEGNHRVSVEENVLLKSEYLKRNNLYSSILPFGGEWKVGDAVYHQSPTASGFMGWVCTTAGNPGVWKKFGTIES